MNLVQFKRHDADGDVSINPAHVAMVEPSGASDHNVTDIVVAAHSRHDDRKPCATAAIRSYWSILDSVEAEIAFPVSELKDSPIVGQSGHNRQNPLSPNIASRARRAAVETIAQGTKRPRAGPT